MPARTSAVRIRGSDLSAMGLVRSSIPWKCPGFDLSDLSGRRVSLDRYAGSLVLINFWSIRFEACRREWVSLQGLFEQMEGRDFAILVVNTGDPVSEVQEWCRDRTPRFPILLDPHRTTAEACGVSAVPSTFLLDRDGRVLAKATGAREWSSGAAAEMFRRLLGERVNRHPPGREPAGNIRRGDGSGWRERRRP